MHSHEVEMDESQQKFASRESLELSPDTKSDSNCKQLHKATSQPMASKYSICNSKIRVNDEVAQANEGLEGS